MVLAVGFEADVPQDDHLVVTVDLAERPPEKFHRVVAVTREPVVVRLDDALGGRAQPLPFGVVAYPLEQLSNCPFCFFSGWSAHELEVRLQKQGRQSKRGPAYAQPAAFAAAFAAGPAPLYLRRVTETTKPEWPARPALFLDLDGTLLELAEEPHAVEPSGRLRRLLPLLKAATGGAVAFVSGRPIREIDSLLAPHRFALAGVHGNERRSNGTTDTLPTNDPGALDGIRHELAAYRAANPGVIVEDKQIGVALHYRKRSDLECEVLEFAARLEALLPPDYELLRGSKVVEVKPSAMNKGAAVRAFMREPPFADRTPVFVGDDVTDEAAFEAVNSLGGVAVKVRSGISAAPWRLPDVDAVLTWLEALVDRDAGVPHG